MSEAWEVGEGREWNPLHRPDRSIRLSKVVDLHELQVDAIETS